MSEPDLTALNAEQIRDFICCEAGKRKTGSCRLVIAAIRAFLRFLAAKESSLRTYTEPFL
jgi:hypothetical protein